MKRLALYVSLASLLSVILISLTIIGLIVFAVQAKISATNPTIHRSDLMSHQMLSGAIADKRCVEV
ncbi:MAG: hypothetical protein ACAF41_01695 [Leptolyngbya sp. BL-A-14]